MPRHIALLRGVSPMNCRMPVLQRCLESAGFTDVKTLLSSGNVAFTTPRPATPAALQKRVEKALLDGAGYGFMTVVRPVTHLRRLLDSDPFTGFDLPPGSKRVITFLREPEAVPDVALPFAKGAYLRNAQGFFFWPGEGQRVSNPTADSYSPSSQDHVAPDGTMFYSSAEGLQELSPPADFQALLGP